MLLDELTHPITIPAIGGVFCLLLPKGWQRERAWVCIAATALTLFSASALFLTAKPAIAESWFLLDQLSLLVLLATTVFAFLIAIYSHDYMKGKKGERTYFVCLLWSLSLSCGAILASNLILLLVCWGLLAVTLYLMIGLESSGSEAARKMFIIVGGSDSLLLLGTVLIWVQHNSTRLDAGTLSLDSPVSCIAFFCLLAAVFAKVGAVPLHSWLPDCSEKAAAPVTAFLPASLDKLLGVYLLVRVTTDLFEMTTGLNILLMILGTITIVSAGLIALVQNDVKRLLGYCAVSQVGYILLAIGTGTSLGMAAALFHMLNHAIYKSCLFLVAGVIENKTGTVDLDRLGGLATRLPITFAACLIASLSVAGIPPLNGFASKWLIYQAVIESGQASGNMLWVIWLTAAMLGSVLTLALIVKMLHGAFLCKPSPLIRELNIERTNWLTAAPLVVLAGSCVVFGIFPTEIPLSYLILPVLNEPVSFPGTWMASQVTALLVIAFLLGWIFYALTLRNGKLRRCSTYIGGERLSEARIPGVPAGPTRHVEVTGVDFYQTVEQLPLLQPVYAMAKRKLFDVFESGRRSFGFLADTLGSAHAGLLPRYLTWFVLGLLIVLYVMTGGTAEP